MFCCRRDSGSLPITLQDPVEFFGSHLKTREASVLHWNPREAPESSLGRWSRSPEFIAAPFEGGRMASPEDCCSCPPASISATIWTKLYKKGVRPVDQAFNHQIQDRWELSSFLCKFLLPVASTHSLSSILDLFSFSSFSIFTLPFSVLCDSHLPSANFFHLH